MKVTPVSIEDIYKVSKILNIEFDDLNKRFFNKQKGICLYETLDGEIFFKGAALFNNDELEDIKCEDDNENYYKYLIRNLPKTVYKTKVHGNMESLIKVLKSYSFLEKYSDNEYLLLERKKC